MGSTLNGQQVQRRVRADAQKFFQISTVDDDGF